MGGIVNVGATRVIGIDIFAVFNHSGLILLNTPDGPSWLAADGERSGAADPVFSAGRFLTPARDDDERTTRVTRRTEERNGV